MRIFFGTVAAAAMLAGLSGCGGVSESLAVEGKAPVYPVLALKEANPVLRLDFIRTGDGPLEVSAVDISLKGTDKPKDVESVSLYGALGNGFIDTARLIYGPVPAAGKVRLDCRISVDTDTLPVWVAVKMRDVIDLDGFVSVACTGVAAPDGKAVLPAGGIGNRLRTGVAVRKHGDDGVHSYRIPGLVRTDEGTLIALYDVRRDLGRDLQGDIDIGINRSFDGGASWEPLQVVMDMGQWGGLPRKFNGVSDACVLVDRSTGDVIVAGLWMHGVINEEGRWLEGLTEESTEWNHQWRNRGSQPGFGVRETSQFLITRSSDDGATWAEPENITRMGKREEWWLWAPAPGNGITMLDGTLVMPTQGRDHTGKSFSNITWSRDGGRTWTSSEPAAETPLGTTECAVVELSDGTLMLNMRDNRNRTDPSDENGRTVAVTADLGQTWTVHPTSRGALVEPTCMASLYRHDYTDAGERRSVLLFCNPASKEARVDMTLKASFDDGMTWPAENSILLDEGRGRGYSCIASVGEDHIGVLYEGSQADMIFQRIPLGELQGGK
ncbi:MAG: exo-alpha-sialidase [Alistipes sp.]|nr:exo-alpha-sialidase [Alistipes sp.]